jgi:hypothetical protein
VRNFHVQKSWNSCFFIPDKITAGLHIDRGYPCASAGHGEVDRVVGQIAEVRRRSSLPNRQAPVRVCSLFSKEALLPRLIAELESAPI